MHTVPGAGGTIVTQRILLIMKNVNTIYMVPSGSWNCHRVERNGTASGSRGMELPQIREEWNCLRVEKNGTASGLRNGTSSDPRGMELSQGLEE